jgi:hypothetical protein
MWETRNYGESGTKAANKISTRKTWRNGRKEDRLREADFVNGR